jgi:hypothetical protein
MSTLLIGSTVTIWKTTERSRMNSVPGLRLSAYSCIPPHPPQMCEMNDNDFGTRLKIQYMD